MNRIRKLAEELLAKYPTKFSTNFEDNKKALDEVAIITNRALRNQIAGAISTKVAETQPKTTGGEAAEEPLVEVQSASSESDEAEPVSKEA